MWRDIDLKVDIDRNTPISIEVNQADDLRISMYLYKSGVPVNLVEGEDTIIVNYANANGTITSDADIGRKFVGNMVIIHFPRNCTNSSGIAHMQVTINSNRQYEVNTQTTSFPIDIKIKQSVVDGKEVSTNINSMIDDINKATIEGKEVIKNIEETGKKYPTSSQLYSDVERLKSREYKLLNSTYDILLQSEGLYKGLNLINAPNQDSIIYYYDVKVWSDGCKRIEALRCTTDEIYINNYKNGGWSGWESYNPINYKYFKQLTPGTNYDVRKLVAGRYYGLNLVNAPQTTRNDINFYYEVFQLTKGSDKYKKIIASDYTNNDTFVCVENYGVWSDWDKISYQSFTKNPSNITQDSNHRFVSDTEKNKWNMVTGNGPKQQNSYLKLPSGIIIQWGVTNVSVPSKSSATATATFPTPFPNKLLTIQTNVNRNISTTDKTGCENIISNGIMASGIDVDKTKVDIFARDCIGSGSNWTFEVGWIAIGY